MGLLKLRCVKFLTNVTKRSALLHYRSLTAASFKYEDLQVTLTDKKQEKPDPNNLLFGHNFSDHMLQVEWTRDDGWGKPIISPLTNLSIHPGAKCLHYAIELFEGMKAYRGVDDKIRMFRPFENMKRMKSTADRAYLPDFDAEELVKCMKKLLQIDREWVPYSTKSSLYLRPTFIGTEPTLGVTKSASALLYVLTGPVGPYYPTGMNPVTLLADPQYVRAWPGGCGNFKMGSNYGPTIKISAEADKKGCQQVLWLYGDDHQLTEVGAMNLFVYWINEQGEKELVTAPLDGLVLPGITRKSLIELAKKWGEFKVTERSYTMAEVTKALNENRLKEMFGAGTACVVSPVEKILYIDNMLNIPTMSDGAPVTMRFLKELTDIHYGRTISDWCEPIE
ncbi:branched-chain-amino-acid aminotransferase, cytosolic-like isoform X1 [Mytilus galloprovincialis]|uniref:branched-chain-amino-acid aminotransferase, cytosolic-like isoform X1 n=1 Tax=Mytilus galloprovincialis TaxID=29158 RepID=UPI003F7CB9B0